MQAKGRLQCCNADGQELGGSCREGCAGKGQAATLEQQRLTARGLGGSCREEAVQQLEGCKGFERLKGLGGRWGEGFVGF